MNDATSNLDPQAEPSVSELNATPRTQSVINRSAVKAYALKVAKERRPKFTRVSEDFLTAVEAEVEAVIRQTALGIEPMVPPADDREFITGAALDRIRQKLHERTQRIVQGKVLRHPSIGCTLKD